MSEIRKKLQNIDFIFSASLFALGVMLAAWHHDDSFNDLKVYINGLSRYRSGENPYNYSEIFIYIMPPLITSLINVPILLLIMCFLCISGFMCVFMIYKKDRGAFAFGAAGLFAGESGGSWISGNISFPLHLSIILYSLFYLVNVRDRYRKIILISVVIAASSIKPYFAAYLIVFFVPKKISISSVAFCFGSILVIYNAQMVLMPAQWNDFVTAVHIQAIDRGDFGFTLASTLANRGHLLAGLFSHESIIITITGVIWLRYRSNIIRYSETSRFIGAIPYYFLACAIISNPRLKEYDVFAFNFCCFLFLYHAVVYNAFRLHLILLLSIFVVTVYELAERSAIHFRLTTGLLLGRNDLKEITTYALFLFSSWIAFAGLGISEGTKNSEAQSGATRLV